MSHYDQLSVRVRLLDVPWDEDPVTKEPVLPAEEWYVEFGRGDRNLSDVAREVESLSAPRNRGTDDFVGGCCDPSKYPSFLHLKYNSFEWGASAATLAIILDVAVGIGGAAIYDGLKALLERWSEHRRDFYTDDEIVAKCSRMLRARLFPPPRELHLKSVTNRGGEGGSAELIDEHGVSHVVEIHRHRGSLILQSVTTRSNLPGS